MSSKSSDIDLKRREKSKNTFTYTWIISNVIVAGLIFYMFLFQSYMPHLIALIVYIIISIILLLLIRLFFNRNFETIKQKLESEKNKTNKIKEQLGPIKTEIDKSRAEIKDRKDLKEDMVKEISKKINLDKLEELLSEKENCWELLVKKEDDKNNNNKKKDREKETLILPGGIVRGILMISVTFVSLYYIFTLLTIPLHFIIILNIILVYYGIKPKDVLPKQFVVDIPEMYGTISRMPIIPDLIENVEDRLKDIEDWTLRLLREFKKDVTKLTRKVENLREKVNAKIDSFTDLVSTLTVKSKSLLEQIGLIIILIITIVLSALFISSSNQPLDFLNIILASTIALITIAFGINIQEIMMNHIKPWINCQFNEIIGGLTIITDSVEELSDDILNTIEKIEDQLDKIKTTNFLMYLPKDLVASISVNGMVAICGLMFILPIIAFNQVFLIIIEFIIGYYFMTKK